MTPALDLAQGTLPPTATYARREWRWTPAPPWAVCLGVLTVALQHGERDGRARPVKLEMDHYGVEEELDLCLPAGVRSFLLENAEDPDEFGPFRCVVGSMVETCGCEAGNADLRRTRPTSCKHRDALTAMIREGVI